MEVGQAAAEAIKKVHGKTYTVGASPDVLCKLIMDGWKDGWSCFRLYFLKMKRLLKANEQ